MELCQAHKVSLFLEQYGSSLFCTVCPAVPFTAEKETLKAISQNIQHVQILCWLLCRDSNQRLQRNHYEYPSLAYCLAIINALVWKMYILLFQIKQSTMQASDCCLHVPDKAKGRLFSVLHGSGVSVNFSQWNPHWECQLLGQKKKLKVSPAHTHMQIFIRKARVMGRREEDTRSDMTGLRGISKLLQRDSTSGVKKHFENSLRSNYCITNCRRGQGQMQYTGSI